MDAYEKYMNHLQDIEDERNNHENDIYSEFDVKTDDDLADIYYDRAQECRYNALQA